MVGHGLYYATNASTGKPLNGTLDWLVADPRTAAEFGQLRTASSSATAPPVWRHREDVLIINDVNSANATGLRSSDHSGAVGGFLRPGWGGSADSIGPELGFGWAIGDALHGNASQQQQQQQVSP